MARPATSRRGRRKRRVRRNCLFSRTANKFPRAVHSHIHGMFSETGCNVDAMTLIPVAFLQRPPRLLANPVCAVFSTYYAYVYSCIFCFIVTMYADVLLCSAQKGCLSNPLKQQTAAVCSPSRIHTPVHIQLAGWDRWLGLHPSRHRLRRICDHGRLDSRSHLSLSLATESERRHPRIQARRDAGMPRRSLALP